MTQKIKAKIPKLKKEDRVKIIDRPDLLLVEPLTHQASIRYGHKSSWCTSTGNTKTFTGHIKTNILLHCIIYNVNEDGKRGEEKTKIAISKPKRSRSFKRIVCYDRFDRVFNMELLETLLNKEDFDILIDYLKIKSITVKRQLIKQQTSEFSIGNIVRCYSNKKIKIKFAEYDEVAYSKHLKRQSRPIWQAGNHYKNRHFVARVLQQPPYIHS